MSVLFEHWEEGKYDKIFGHKATVVLGQINGVVMNLLYWRF